MGAGRNVAVLAAGSADPCRGFEVAGGFALCSKQGRHARGPPDGPAPDVLVDPLRVARGAGAL
jgi:hypothetical protein